MRRLVWAERERESVTRVSTSRLSKVASYHHLPRISSSCHHLPRIPATKPSTRDSTPVPHVAARRTVSCHQISQAGQLAVPEEPLKYQASDEGREEVSDQVPGKRGTFSDQDGEISEEMASRGEGGSSVSEMGQSSSPCSSLSESSAYVELCQERDVSISRIDECRAVHRYIASRGQREKEQEICLVIPAVIEIYK